MSVRRTPQTLLALGAGAVLIASSGGAAQAEGGRDRPAPGSGAGGEHRYEGQHLPDEGEIAALFDDWNAALATGDADQVVALYTPDAVLLPTLSAENRVGREAIAAYFTEDFLPRQPQGEVTESEVRVLDEDSALHTGDYTFTFGSDGSVARARFTYVYEQQDDGRWLIVTHHSSVEPAS